MLVFNTEVALMHLNKETSASMDILGVNAIKKIKTITDINKK